MAAATKLDMAVKPIEEVEDGTSSFWAQAKEHGEHF
jgi:hypothetical protein